MSDSTLVNATVEAADEAYSASLGATPRERATWLEAVAASLEAAGDELVALAQDETHLPEGRLRGELARTAFQLRLLGDEVADGQHLDATIDEADPDWGMGPRPDLRRVNIPLGVVAVFGASNFPFAFSVMGGDSASALAAGCAVVHKVHDAHPRLGARTAELAEGALTQAGAPAGLLSTVTGDEAAGALLDHPRVKAVGFTGSTHVGRMLHDRVAARPEPIPFYGELGSTNPVFVTEGAWRSRREEILEGYAGSLTLGMGQFCTNPGLLFVPDLTEVDVVTLEGALAKAASFPMLSTRLAEGYAHAVERIAATAGVRTVVPGDGGKAPTPTVLTTTAEEALRHPGILGEEMFGPAGLIVRYGTEDELPGLAGLIEGQLTATIRAEADDAPRELLALLTERAGRVVWNGWPTGVTVSYAQQHGGPYPATTAAGTTSVGTAAIRRFLRPVAYQNLPSGQLPPALRKENPWGIPRRVNGTWRR